MTRLQPPRIGTVTTARPTVTVASPLYRSRTVDTGRTGDVYEVKTDDTGRITEVYALLADGMSMREYAMTSPQWRKITEGDSVTLTRRIETRMYRHEHGDYYGCTTCPYDVVESQWAASPLARAWKGERGWKVSDTTHGGITVMRAVVRLDDGTDDELSTLVWF